MRLSVIIIAAALALAPIARAEDAKPASPPKPTIAELQKQVDLLKGQVVRLQDVIGALQQQRDSALDGLALSQADVAQARRQTTAPTPHPDEPVKASPNGDKPKK